MIRIVVALAMILSSTVSSADKPKPSPAAAPVPTVEKIDETEQTSVNDVSVAAFKMQEQADAMKGKLNRLVALVTERHKCTQEEINWETAEIVRADKAKSPMPDPKEKKLAKK